MKKTLFTMLMIASCFGAVNAQLRVDKNGRTAIGTITTDTLCSQLSINGRGENNVAVHVKTQDIIGLKINRTGQYTSTTHYGLYVHNEPMGWDNYGIYARCKKGNSGTPNTSIGVGGFALGSTNGRSFGVAGFLGDPYGAGIFGTASSNIPNIAIEGAYAGFFHGAVYATGSITTPAILTPSDYRLKREIKTMSSSCLDKVLSMNIVEFKYKQREFDVETTGIDTEERASWYDAKSALLTNKHYGFIAQELQKIYPDLVIEGEDGFLGVNYIEIIPLLVRSIQELNAKVEQYENGGAPVYKAQTRSAEEATAIDAIVTTLYQNSPNPFTESTLIRCDVADDVVKADLYIYNMNGEQITEYAITERGETSIVIDGGSLNAGMYLYALIADGQVIDTKRMILTE